MVLEGIIDTYFIYPLVNRTNEYNPVNTITYAVVFFLVTYLLYEKILKNRVNIDSKFAVVFVSFTIFASGMHVLEDMKIVSSILLVTPLIQVVMYASFLVLLSASLVIQKLAKIEYWKTLLFITSIPSVLIVTLILSRAQNIAGLFYIMLSFAASTAILYFVHKKFPKTLSKENLMALSAHMLDASSTFVSISFFGYKEQHFLPTALIQLFGPAVMFPLKLLVIGFVLYSFDREIKNKDMRTFFKIIVLVLGLAPGLRDTLRLSVPA
ncbi:MAG: DUF63 family protein [Candidatus Aenigmarchaeota archaeon]|nr:DUF63 family protein [Candidatus Aenigmarchaeota archaeon]